MWHSVPAWEHMGPEYVRAAADLCLLFACSTGNINLAGAVNTVFITASGVGKVFVSGVTGSVNVNLCGIGQVVLDPSSRKFAIILHESATVHTINFLIAVSGRKPCSYAGQDVCK